MLKSESRFAAILVKNLELSGQNISLELEDVAMGDPIFKNTRMMAKLGYKKGKDASKIISQAIKKGKRDTTGLGYKEEVKKMMNAIIFLFLNIFTLMLLNVTYNHY